MININDKIPGAPNFRYREFIRSDVAFRLGISNMPNAEQWSCIENLAREVLQPVRNEFGSVRITSGFRTVELCLAIGSSKHSNHARGQAGDIEPMYYGGIELITMLEFIHDELEYRALIAEYFPDGWIHVAYREGANVKKLKLKDKNHHYENVSIDYLKDLYQ